MKNQAPRPNHGAARPRLNQLRILCATALMAALSIVLGKYLQIPLGDSIRISFENLPVLMAGIFFGPVIGGAVGMTADLLGCVLVGYSINPIITAGAALVGILSGAVAHLFRRGGRDLTATAVITAVYTAHAVGSMTVKSFGLWVYFSTPLPLLLARVPVYVAVGALEATVIWLLARNRIFMGELRRLLTKKR